MANIYGKRGKADQKNRDGGYKNVLLFAPVDTFLSLKLPTTPPVVAGDKVSITTAHTFGVGDGFINWLCKTHGVTSKGQTVGDDGVGRMEWQFDAIILGDSASTVEQIYDLLNDQCIFLLKDQDCHGSTEFVQFGDDCTQPTVKVAWDGKTTKDGQKEYTITGTIYGKKYFYSGTVTEKP